MLFNSLDFLIFLPIVFGVYWAIRNIQVQNAFLLLASYVFYGWWDWRFLLLIIFSSALDYLCGLGLERSSNDRKRKWILSISLVMNLGLLGVFKYFNFFTAELALQASRLGVELQPFTLNVLLPVGISFYTFQTLSYTIDVYRRRMRATRNPLAFFTYVAFFPQLVAGPIERASELLPQILRPRKFDFKEAVSGVEQMLWGFFKKIVIADNCARFVALIFDGDTIGSTHGGMLALGAVLFAFQIYGDFSGYSDIAIGVARLLGIKLMTNFSYPYFSRNIAEFWRRWHISLSTWFRDYLYIPLGGSRVPMGKAVRNIFIIFLVSGFWHGANKTFIAWGAYNALLFMPLFFLKRNRADLKVIAHDRRIPPLTDVVRMLITFGLVCIGWVFFRADNLHEAYHFLTGMALNYGDGFSFQLSELHQLNSITGTTLLWVVRRTC
ncbi:MAG: MBOAT family protein [Flavobacteriales bacterium]|nr:MBOAT family protein [Flavobacteriales bacterium]